MRNADNITVACMGLDIFTKSWCINCAETDKQKKLVFRCDRCTFCKENGRCSVKEFVVDNLGKLPDGFGSIGR